ncbi:unnamed protein product [Phytomonas sp. EM1]|nr:unnamed protein product [Phytomonas sp. EM1]|eukprot:CCW62328.1 unnamed protein product [Phytomonas sp. isolate EM1]
MTVAPSRPVEIIVHDVASRRTVDFKCDIDLLRCNMRYFDPIIRKRLELESANQCETNGSSDDVARVFVPTESSCISSLTEPVSIKVNCDVDIFHWLFDWMMASKKPALKPSIVVSVLLSSNFLLMNDLVEVALQYLCGHFVEVILSDVDMNCLTGELVGRLCSIITDADLARWYLRLYQFGKENHPNRSFMTSLLWHWVIDRVGYAVFPTGSLSGDNRGAPSSRTTPLRRPESRNFQSNEGASRPSTRFSVVSKRGSHLQDQPRAGGFVETENNTLSNEFRGENNGGLRWCCLCGILFDNQEYRRILRSTAHTSSKGALPNDGRSPSIPTSQPVKECICAGLSSPTGGPCMGPRGAMFTTHAPSRLSVSLEPPSPRLKSGAVEHWAWQVVGVMRFVVCCRCRRILPLIEVVSHHCKSAQKGLEFAPAERLTPGTCAALDVYSLIHWYRHMAQAGVYREEGNLVPIRCPPSMVGFLNAERILLSTPTTKQKRTSFLTSDPPNTSCAVRTYSWDADPVAVDEVVMQEVALSASQGNRRLIDVDVQNHYERQFMNALMARLSATRTTSLSSTMRPQEVRHGDDPTTAFPTPHSHFADGNSITSGHASSKLIRADTKSRGLGPSRANKASGKTPVLSVYCSPPSPRNSHSRNQNRKKGKMVREMSYLPRVLSQFEK